jgi:hypothetical protein
MDEDKGSISDDTIGLAEVDVSADVPAAATSPTPHRAMTLQLRPREQQSGSAGRLDVDVWVEPLSSAEEVGMERSGTLSRDMAPAASAVSSDVGAGTSKPPQDPQRVCGMVWLEVLAARDLPDRDTVGKQDPYAVLWVEPQRQEASWGRGRWRNDKDAPPFPTAVTGTVVDGGRNPVWTHAHRSRIACRVDGAVVGEKRVLGHVEVWDEVSRGVVSGAPRSRSAMTVRSLVCVDRIRWDQTRSLALGTSTCLLPSQQTGRYVLSAHCVAFPTTATTTTLSSFNTLSSDSTPGSLTGWFL